MRLPRSAAARVVVIAALLLLAAGNASAATIYFSATRTFGLDPEGLDPIGSATPEQGVPAGNPLAGVLDSLDLSFDQALAAVIQRPETPSSTTPFIFDMLFTISNTSGEALEDAVLAFTRVMPAWPAPGDPFPNHALGFDEGDVDILVYEISGQDDIWLPVLLLGPLAADAEPVTRVIRFTVESELPLNESGGFILPEVGAAGFRSFTSVPEPGPIVLVGLVLLGLWRVRRAAGPLLLLALLLTPTGARAEDEQAVRVLRAGALAREGDCEGARRILERDAPRSGAERWLDVGRCFTNAGDYPAARSALERAIQIDSGLATAYLSLGVLHFHEGDQAAARAALDRARAAGVDDGAFHLYSGLLDLDAGERASAIRQFERARELDGNTEPYASYYEGRALEEKGDFAAAARAYARTARGAPDSPWTQEARRGLERVGIHSPGRSWLEGMTGGEYDTNVALVGAGVVLPEELKGQRDARLVWSAEAGAEFVRGPDWRMGALAYYFGSQHDDLDDFDLTATNGALWYERDLSEDTRTQVRYDFRYIWAGHRSFLSSHSLTPSLFQDWGRKGRTRLVTSVYSHDFRYPVPTVPDVPGVDEKSVRRRDGNGFSIGAEHRLPIGFFDS